MGCARRATLFAALLDETDVDIMAWAIGTQAVPERFAGPMMDAMQRLDYLKVAQVSEPLQRILSAKTPLTLAGVPAGFLPWLAGDLARAAHGAGGPTSGRAVVVVADELAMRALADTVPVFAPEVEVLQLPAWDCLPYDRSSPALRVMAERLATLHALQVPRKGPQLLIVTANAATQRVLTPFRIRQLTRRLAAGERIDREALIALLGANGYQRTDAVADAGEYAVRGSLIDLFPAGEPTALRLDFFGDEIESVRRFDPADQRTIGPADAFTLMPASRGPARRGRRSSGSARAIARRSAPMPPATRSTRRSVRRAAAGRDGALAAAVRGVARHAVRSSRRE